MSEALLLMAVGMITVFVVLLLVVLLGNVIIRFVNRFIPEEVSNKGSQGGQTPAVDSKIYAAICSAVSVVTAGKGSVVDVKKL